MSRGLCISKVIKPAVCCLVFLYSCQALFCQSSYMLSPSLEGFTTVPLGNYREIADVGGGPVLKLYANDFFFNRSVLVFSNSFSFLKDSSTTINSYSSLSLSLLGGYSFHFGKVSLSPLVGFGYLCHMIEGSTPTDSVIERRYYFDPQLSLEPQLRVTLPRDFYVNFGTGLVVFFEEEKLGSYINVGIGLSKAYRIPRKERQRSGIKSVLGLDHSTFSPNKDGRKDEIRIYPEAERGFEFDTYELTIRGANNNISKSVLSNNSLPGFFTWDGTDNANNLAEDGEYVASLVLLNGNRTACRALSAPFILDTVPPDLRLTVSLLPSSPEGERADSELLITAKIDSEDDVANWRLDVRTPSGESVYSTFGDGSPPSVFEWNVSSENGERAMPAQDYTLSMAVTDQAGNKTTVKELIPIEGYAVDKPSNPLDSFRLRR